MSSIPANPVNVWAWSDNPSGMFAPFKPALSCP